MDGIRKIEALRANGFQVEFHAHALAILTMDFPAALGELADALLIGLPSTIVSFDDGARPVENA
jgi:hypothetical protein